MYTSLGEYGKAAQLCPKVLNNDVKKWEDWVFVFAQKHQLQVRDKHYMTSIEFCAIS